jgi:hypothetical protein
MKCVSTRQNHWEKRGVRFSGHVRMYRNAGEKMWLLFLQNFNGVKIFLQQPSKMGFCDSTLCQLLGACLSDFTQWFARCNTPPCTREIQFVGNFFWHDGGGNHIRWLGLHYFRQTQNIWTESKRTASIPGAHWPSDCPLQEGLCRRSPFSSPLSPWWTMW